MLHVADDLGNRAIISQFVDDFSPHVVRSQCAAQPALTARALTVVIVGSLELWLTRRFENLLPKAYGKRVGVFLCA